MPTIDYQTRLDAIVAWMRDPANAERRALFCLVNVQGLWLVPNAEADVTLSADAEHGLALISAPGFLDAVTAKDHNLANKIARAHNARHETRTAQVTPMRVGDAMDKAARTYAAQIKS